MRTAVECRCICAATMAFNCKNVKRINELFKYYSTRRTHYDVIVAGGGMVGTTMACVLGKNSMFSDKNVLLLEGGKEMKFSLNENYSNRVSAVNKQTYNLMNSIGAWNRIRDCRYAPVRSMRVWDACSDAAITFNEDESDEIAYIVENDVILNAVSTELKDVRNVDVSYGARVRKYDVPIDRRSPVRVSTENGDDFTCDLLIGADGFDSTVRKTTGFDHVSWNYDRTGVVATVRLSEPIENTVAWQRFLPTGTIALLPLDADTSSLVWCTTPTEAKRLIRADGRDFVDAVNAAFRNEFPRDRIVDSLTAAADRTFGPSDAASRPPPTVVGTTEKSRAGFPLGFGHSSGYVADRVALIGDAAHRVHPLAGQGVNLGFGDVSCLSESLARSVYDGGAVDRPGALKAYEKERLRRNVPTALAIDGLHRLYGTTFTPVVVLRSLGLRAVHSLKPLKKAIVRHATGA